LQQSDPTIKIIPPYRVRPMGVPKQALPRDKDKDGHVRLSNGPTDAPVDGDAKPRASSADRTVVANCVMADSNSLDSSALRRLNNGPKTPLEMLAAASAVPLPATAGLSDSMRPPINNGTNGADPRLHSASTKTPDGDPLLPADPPPTHVSGASPVASAGPKQTSGTFLLSGRERIHLFTVDTI
jgi:hypothetical protein